MKHSEYVKIVSTLVTNSLKEALVKGVIKQLPFLASGPWSFVLVKLAGKIAQMAAEEAEFQIFFPFIDFRTDVQAKDFESAMIKNHTIQKIGTDEEKAKSEEDLKNALIKLAHLKR